MARVHYRFRLHAKGQSVGGSPLAPRVGAAHTDLFLVTTEPNAGQWKPYLQLPQGAEGRLDPLTRHTEMGEYTISLLDKRVLTDNAIRWVTSFLGDDKAVNQLLGLVGQLEEQIDGGVWTSVFVGKIVHVGTPNPDKDGPLFVFRLKDTRVEEYRTVFSGAPHHSVLYARPCPLLPIGLPTLIHDPWRWENTYKFQHALMLEADDNELNSSSVNTNAQLLNVQLYSEEPQRLKVSVGLAESLDARDTYGPHGNASGRTVCDHVRLRVMSCAGFRYGQPLYTDTQPYTVGNPNGYPVVWGDYYVTPVGGKSLFTAASKKFGYDGEAVTPLRLSKDKKNHPGHAASIGVCALPVTHPHYQPLSMLATGAKGYGYLYRAGPPTNRAPLLINPVHPVQLWMDMCDGKFSDLGINGEVLRNLIPYDLTEMTAKLADKSIPLVRFLISKPWEMQEFLENQLFKYIHLCSRTTGTGAVFPVDLRLPDSDTLVATPEWDNEDIIESSWEQGEDLITFLAIAVHTHGFEDEILGDLDLDEEDDHESFVDVNCSGLTTRTMQYGFLSDGADRLPVKKEDIDAAGLLPPKVVFIGGNADPRQALFTRETLQPIAREFLGPFGTGAAYARTLCRRTTKVQSSNIGNWIKVTIKGQPNAANVQRGGQRMMQIIARQYDHATGLYVIRLLDGGPAVNTIVPTLSNLVGVPGSEQSSYKFTLTVPVPDRDVVQVQQAITNVNVTVRPASKSELWLPVMETRTSGDVVVGGQPSGKRLWVRARVAGNNRLPSPWAYPSNNYFDTSSPFDTILYNVIDISNTSASVTWSGGKAEHIVLVYVNLGVTSSATTETLVATVLGDAGVITVQGLERNTFHTLTIVTTDEFGGSQTPYSVTFSTSNFTVGASRPAGFAVNV